MKHPTREDWIAFLYEETPAEERAPLQAHLDSCPECREQLARWQGATQQLDAWQLSPPRKATRPLPLVRWAVAASILALATIGSARLYSLDREVKQLRAELPAQVEGKLNALLAQATEQATKSASAEAQALIAAVAEKWEEKRLADQQSTLTALQKLNTQYVTDYASLRKELETVAVVSEASWRRAENQISSLATVPAPVSEPK